MRATYILLALATISRALSQVSTLQAPSRAPLEQQLAATVDTGAAPSVLPLLFVSKGNGGDATKGRTLVQPNVEVVAALSRLERIGAIAIPLSDDTIVAILHDTRTTVRNQSRTVRTLTGNVRNRALTDVALSVTDTTLTGFIRLGDTLIHIRSGPGGHMVDTSFQSERPSERAPLTPPKKQPALAKDAGVTEDIVCEPVSVGVLVVLTARAAGVKTFEAINTMVRNEIAITNRALKDSGIPHQVHLAGLQVLKAEEFTESAYAKDESLEGDITRLQALGAIRKARNQYLADVVSVWTQPLYGDKDGCGISWITEDALHGAETGYGLVPLVCLERYSFAHELGHTLGMDHDYDNQLGRGIRPYARGYRVKGQFSTLEAYPCEGEEKCPRDRIYSSPSKRVGGVPAGVDGDNVAHPANDARAASWSMCAISNWHRVPLPSQ